MRRSSAGSTSFRSGHLIKSQYPQPTDKFLGSIRHRRELLPLVRAFAAAKQALPAVDFADQMTLAARLAQLPEVAAIERERFATVLLDEYQDTGHAQVETLRGLFGQGHPVTAVGDPFQSIYGWRGASAGNIGRFAADLRRVRRHAGDRVPVGDELPQRPGRSSTPPTPIAAPLRTGASAASTVELRPGPAAGPGTPAGGAHPHGRGRGALGGGRTAHRVGRPAGR